MRGINKLSGGFIFLQTFSIFANGDAQRFHFNQLKLLYQFEVQLIKEIIYFRI